MRTLKKTIAILLSVVMTFAMYGVAFAEDCTHENVFYLEPNENPICGEQGHIGCWCCDNCYSAYFADEEKTQPLTYSEVYCIDPAYAEHDIAYELGFEESEDQAWLSYNNYMDVYFQQQYGKTVPEWYAEQGYTFWYCSNCGAISRYDYDMGGGQVYSSYSRISDTFTVHVPGEVITDPNEGFNLLPTEDSDEFETGTYWFDKAGFIELILKNEDPESDDYEMIYNYYNAAEFYLSEDESTVRIIIMGNPVDIEVTDPENAMYTRFLVQHGVDPFEGYNLLPTADSDELEDGDWYLDLEGLVLAMTGSGATEEEIAETLSYYESFRFYLSDDGETLLMDMPYGTQELTRDGEGAYYFMFVRQHGVEPADLLEGFERVAYSTDDIPFIGYLFLVEDFLESYAAELAEDINHETNELYTEEEIAAIIEEQRALILETGIYINTSKGQLAIVEPGMMPMILSLDSEDAAEIVEFITRWEREFDWIPVHMTTDGLKEGDYWFDLEPLMGPDDDINEYIEYITISILNEPAAFRYTETDPETGKVYIDILPGGEDYEEFALDYNMLASNTYQVFSVDKAASCYEPGYTGALAIEKDGETVILAEGEEIPVCHAYGEPVWTWSDDFTPTATFTCSKCGDVQTPEVSVSTYMSPPGGTYDGVKVYTGYVYFEGQGYTDEEREVLPATGGEDPTNPSEPTTNPSEPTTEPEEPSSGNICKYDGEDHGNSFWGRLVTFFHSIAYFFAHLFGWK